MSMRSDHLTAAFIDLVIAAGAGRGTTEIACVLCGNGVQFDTALRVLTLPRARRRVSRRQTILVEERLARAPRGQVCLDIENQLLKIRVSSR